MSVLRIVCCSLLSLMLAGCQSVAYLGHLGKGQWQMISQRQPLDRVLRNPSTPPLVNTRLREVQDIRRFAEGLGLPVKGQFDTYVNIERPYALWSVAATPELSLSAKRWCYSFFGCLTYRNYFDETLAEQFAVTLQAQGLDTHIGRVAAYSTLGWFRDSLLSSQLNRSPAELAELIFHELAHQMVYAANDPVFNESFAEVVAMESLRRYLVSRPAELQQVLSGLERRREFAELVQEYRTALHHLYQSSQPDEAKRLGKQQLLASLREAHAALRQQQWHGHPGYDAWFAGVNNARLNSVSVYHTLVPALDNLLAASGHDLQRFFAECQTLQSLTKAERWRILGQNPSTHGMME